MGSGAILEGPGDKPNSGPKLWASVQGFSAHTTTSSVLVFLGLRVGCSACRVLLGLSTWQCEGQGSSMSTYPFYTWAVWKDCCGDWEKGCPCLFGGNQEARMLRES